MFSLARQGKLAKGPFVERLVICAAGCNFKTAELSKLYNTLSEEIHGYSWHGTSVLTKLDDFDDEPTKCFIRSFILDLGLTIEV